MKKHGKVGFRSDDYQHEAISKIMGEGGGQTILLFDFEVQRINAASGSPFCIIQLIQRICNIYKGR